MANDEGTFFTCAQELEEGIISGDPARVRGAIRRMFAHAVRLERAVREVEEAHRMPNGEQLDVRQAYATLTRVSELAESLDERWKSVVWMGRGMLLVLGLLGGLATFIFWQIHGEVKHSAETNLEQTLLIKDIQAVQRGVVQELAEMRQARLRRDGH